MFDWKADMDIYLHIFIGYFHIPMAELGNYDRWYCLQSPNHLLPSPFHRKFADTCPTQSR